ncbi:11760_t:CDS:1 [Paraglomus brasilianum]|uniref:11760_t:CDS:1 n=1 Tax=Paraglomus brasilianum TaxID=144538 RepID=A0A9N9AM23_9GLOM|nr:11760_t:CDS:1 [Paraglomus brasilianum]
MTELALTNFDVLRLIVEDISSPQTVYNFALVNRLWNDVSTNFLWSNVQLNSVRAVNAFLRTMDMAIAGRTRYPYTTMKRWMKANVVLEDRDLCRISNKNLARVLDECSYVKSVRLGEFNVGHTIIRSLIRVKSMRSLALTDLVILDVDVLRCLTISHFNYLESIEFYLSSAFIDPILVPMVKNNRNLRSLAVRWDIDDDGFLIPLLKSCPSCLESITIRCPDLLGDKLLELISRCAERACKLFVLGPPIEQFVLNKLVKGLTKKTRILINRGAYSMSEYSLIYSHDLLEIMEYEFLTIPMTANVNDAVVISSWDY